MLKSVLSAQKNSWNSHHIFYDAPSFLQKNSNIENFGSSFSSATIQWHDIFRSLNLNCILMKLQVFIKHALVRKRRHDSVGWNLRSSRMEIKAFLCKPLQRFQSKPLEIRRFKGRSIVINKIILKNCIEKVLTLQCQENQAQYTSITSSLNYWRWAAAYLLFAPFTISKKTLLALRYRSSLRKKGLIAVADFLVYAPPFILKSDKWRIDRMTDS